MKQKNQHIDSKCRICDGEDLVKSFYPDVHFNDKVFTYYKCKTCNSFSTYPDPTEEDFKKMYGENDHTYLKDVNAKIEYDFNFPYANYHGYQIKFLKQIKADLPNKLLLDFGCGSGFYMKYAETLGAKTVGIEFDEKFAELLSQKSGLDISTLSKVKEQYKGKTFDFIHVGHNLEHLTDPKFIMDELKTLANEDTVFLIDGPLERNLSLQRVYVDFGSKVKSKEFNDSVPQHLSLTNQKSQLLFFERVGLKKVKYIVTEQHFPLPDKLSKSFMGVANYFLASTSILISKAIPTSGNVFHYRGKIDQSKK